MGVQNSYRASLAKEPRLRIEKHVLERTTYFVYGRLLGDLPQGGAPALAVVAISSGYHKDEIVDICHLARTSSYYGMNLPAGKFRLVVLADLDGDGSFGRNEVIAFRRLALNAETHADKVARDIDLTLEEPIENSIATLPVPVPETTASQDSLFFPKGTIRTLDDPIFSSTMAELGMYNPAAFMESAPMMFYALEEDLSHKVPVIFVHGIGGSAREFDAIVGALDRARYKPWFFHYPSGMDLHQLARLFFDIFLSGKVIPETGMPVVIVAHSMGGLVVREAVNLRSGLPGETSLKLIVTLATPFGGMPSAGMGARHAPLVVPSWRSLDPAGDFIDGLFRKPLGQGIAHTALYAFRPGADVARLAGGDGTVPLSSQLAVPAKMEFTEIEGFECTHAGILREPAAIGRAISAIGRVQGIFPPDHMRYLAMGGFDVPQGDAYTGVERVLIKSYGFQYRALANGDLTPFHPSQQHFIDVTRGLATPENPAETGWLKFKADCPELAAGRAMDE